MIIGITGTLGAGKGIVAQYLASKHHFTYFSVRNFFAQEVVRRGQLVNRDTVSKVASELKAAHGPNYALQQLFQSAPKGNIVVESIRSVGEAAFLKSKGDALWVVDADIKTRYAHTLERETTVGSGKLSFEEFAAKDKDEALAEVIALANVVLHNDDGKDKLFEQVEQELIKAGFTK